MARENKAAENANILASDQHFEMGEVDILARLMAQHGLGVYSNKFRSEEVDLAAFCFLEASDLFELGVSSQDQEAMLLLITAVRQGQSDG
jgi:hypothetical protein